MGRDKRPRRIVESPRILRRPESSVELLGSHNFPTVKSQKKGRYRADFAPATLFSPAPTRRGRPLETVVSVDDASEIDTRWALIVRITASSHLRRANRLQELLYFLAKSSLNERCESLHEQTIGIRVFGRPEGYDTSTDNIVRTSVSELRKRLHAYFDSEGRDELLTLEIPRWNYVLSFRERSLAKAVELPVAVDPVPADPVTETIDEAGSKSGAARWVLWAAGAAVILVVGLAITCLVLWGRYRTASQQYSNLHRSIYGWQYDPQVAELWNGILSAHANTDIVLADASFGLLQDINRKSFSLDDYLNRSYVEQLRDERISPDLRAILDRITTWNLGSQDEFMLARRILALDPAGNNIQLYSARNYMPALTKRDSVVLIGGRLSNPWQDLFEAHSNFIINFAQDGTITVTNRRPLANEQTNYTQTSSAQYCVISYRPNPEHNGTVLLIQGTDAEATEAAGDFLMSGEKLAAFKKNLHVNQFPYFEVLLRVSSVPGTPLTTSVEAYRTYAR